MEEYTDKSEQTSKYNEAALQIMRLHDYWVRAESYANNGLLEKWKFILDSVWRELVSDVRKSEKKEKWVKENNRLKKAISESKNQVELYNILNERHEFLKEIQDAVGKGGVYGDIDDEDPE